ncbi:heme lyase CcmF/NrfE family subunit [Providencia rettgeri]|uniref:heme lyase CcmF/NrfE family subunit n=1 Tax=Providencia rettgeri TaxID=587 RepID=UPI001B37226E|nr:heme lyase CcmF/NrfE family subunit [Providencia rettgeri]MBQ0368729.1 heme lyase CcmF/NrfE family subunit [Providencia rettgeri]
MELILPEIGFLCLTLALCIAFFQALFGVIGFFRHIPRQMPRNIFWTYLQFFFLFVAYVCLTLSFIQSDFSVVYVAQHSHRLSPLYIKIAAVWGGHEGSIFLWLLFISAWSCLFAWRYRQQTHSVFPLTLTLLAIISTALLLFIVFYSDPFVRIFPPAVEGRDLNPMLQHWGLILHPPLLYLGYSGLMVVTALALASTLCGQFNQTIAGLCWRFTVPSWCILTIGITLGSWWAYSELGWGGWWFWDPVENASLLPWLSATALLHSLTVSHKTGHYRHWSILLAILTFILSLLGTLIVRSGILMSVHAFALDNVRAVPLFLLFSFLSFGALCIYGWKAKNIDNLPTKTNRRQLHLLLTLILFSTVLFIVLTGTLYPMIYTLFGWGKISVGAPYFNQALLPFGILMLIIIAVSAIYPLNKTRIKAQWRILLIILLSVLVSLSLWSKGLVIALSCGFLFAILLIFWLRPIDAIRQQFPSLIAHTGVVIFAAGIALSIGSHHETSVSLSVGQSISLAGYQFQFNELQLEAKSNYTTEKAIIQIRKANQPLHQLITERRFYTARQQLMIEPGIYWGWLRNWYAVLGEKTGTNSYAIRLYVQDGIQWIWSGAFVMCFGLLISWIKGRVKNA